MNCRTHQLDGTRVVYRPHSDLANWITFWFSGIFFSKIPTRASGFCTCSHSTGYPFSAIRPHVKGVYEKKCKTPQIKFVCVHKWKHDEEQNLLAVWTRGNLCGKIARTLRDRLKLMQTGQNLMWCVSLDFFLFSVRTNRQTEQKRNRGRG